MGKVPALKDGDAALGEAAAICAYVADRYPEAKLAPAHPIRCAQNICNGCSSRRAASSPHMIQIFTKLEMTCGTAAWGSATQVSTCSTLRWQKAPWILGENFSAADIVIGSGLNFAVRLFKMVPSRPSFDAYIARCVARPAFQRAEKIAAGKDAKRRAYFARRFTAFQLFRARHRDDVVAGIDIVDFAGDAARQIRQQIQRRAAELIQRHAAAERRMLLLEREHRARIADAGAGQRADRPGGNRIDADAARPKSAAR